MLLTPIRPRPFRSTSMSHLKHVMVASVATRFSLVASNPYITTHCLFTLQARGGGGMHPPAQSMGFCRRSWTAAGSKLPFGWSRRKLCRVVQRKTKGRVQILRRRQRPCGRVDIGPRYVAVKLINPIHHTFLHITITNIILDVVSHPCCSRSRSFLVYSNLTLKGTSSSTTPDGLDFLCGFDTKRFIHNHVFDGSGSS